MHGTAIFLFTLLTIFKSHGPKSEFHSFKYIFHQFIAITTDNILKHNKYTYM